MIINELVRRLDSKNRTISEIVDQDINIKGIYLGNTGPFPLQQTMVSKAYIIQNCFMPEKFKRENS